MLKIEIPQAENGNPLSVPEAAWRAKQNGDMTEKDMFLTMAVWVGENTFKYRPEILSEMAPPNRNYVLGRIQNRASRDPAAGRKLGEWLYSIRKLMSENAANLSCLCFYEEKLIAAEVMPDVAKNMRAMIEQFHRVKLPEHFEEANRVQFMDSQEKGHE